MSRSGVDQDFELLLDYLKESRGFDFTGYKRTTLVRRVRARMATVGIENFEEYRDHLEVDPEEFTQLFNTILINVTSLFRDPESWEVLMTEVIPGIAARKRPGEPIRVWAAGCASGEEAYTLVMAFSEVLGVERIRQQLKVYATDIDEHALAQARQASYGAKDLESVPVDLRERYFEPAGGRFTFRNDLRRNLIFGRHDLMQDAPISHLDLLTCRNALMYFNAEAQARILGRLHFALNDDGALFLGRAEMLLSHGKLFTPLHLKNRIFSKVPRVSMRDRLLVMARGAAIEDNLPPLPDMARLREAALDAEPAAQVVGEAEGHLAIANTAARMLFHLSDRDIGQPLKDLQLSYRPVDLRSAIEQVHRDHRPTTIDGVAWRSDSGQSIMLDVQVIPLAGDGTGPLGTSITFAAVTRFHQLRKELVDSGQESETAYEELQSTNEELQSTNEEMETMNNEEMETMNEELQTTNEELETLNDELRRRSEDFETVNLYLESILGSIGVAVVVVGREGEVHLWNPQAEDFWGLRAEEVVGQHFLNLDIGLPTAELKTILQSCMGGETGGHETTLTAVNRRGRSFSCHVTCRPLRGANQEIRGTTVLMEERSGES